MADTLGTGLGGLETGIDGIDDESGAVGAGSTDSSAPVDTNTAPVAVDDDAGAVSAGTTLVLDAADLLTNDSDANGDALVLDGVGASAHGTVVLAEDGTVSYTPDAGYTGEDSFSYTVSDGNGGVSSAIVTVEVTSEDIASFSVAEAPAVEDAAAAGAAQQSQLGGTSLGPCPVSGEGFCHCGDEAMSQSMAHDDAMMAEHMAMLDLLQPEDATHVAINSGDWSDPATWEGGRIPDQDADVFIPQGVEVVYDVSSEAELHVVRVDGCLHFATQSDTKMVVETIITNFSSTLTIGTAEQPVARGVTAEIVIADNPIDLVADPTQIGNGIVTHGKVEIQGAAKAPYLKLATEPLAGDTELVLEGDVGSWQVGDSLVVMGTQYVGEDANGVLLTQDEEVTIVAIDAATGTVTLDRALQYDHTTPDYEGRDGIDNELSVYVGNSSRNVTISSENPEGVRGHVMFMHNPDVAVRYAEFDELGRTDKSIPINTNELWDEDDWSDHAGPGHKNGPGEEVIGTPRNPGDENVEGRYALHIHRTGAEDGSQMAILEGNAVSGSPGWGIVHHDSHAAIDYNFVYGVSGAGIVSEDANETGQWIGNFVTSTVGVDTDRDLGIPTLEKTGDFGIGGVAFESQARQILQQDNIAANSKTAWLFNTSETSTRGPLVEVIQFDPSKDPFEERERLGEEEAPVINFSGNQIIAVFDGVVTGHRIGNAVLSSDVQQQFTDLTAWRVEDAGVSFFNYTNAYVVKDSLFVDVKRAVKAGDKTEDINLINIHVDTAYQVFESRGYNLNGVYVDITSNNVRVNSTENTLDGSGKVVKVEIESEFRDSSTLSPYDTISFTPDSDARMVIGPERSDLNISGTLTDSAGSWKFFANRTIKLERFAKDGIQTIITESDHEYIFSKYGTIQKEDGSWYLAFWTWVGERVSGENQAVLMPIALEGFDDTYLAQYQIAEFTPPSNVVELYYTDGIQGIDQEFSDAADTGGEDPTDPPVPNSAPVAGIEDQFVAKNEWIRLNDVLSFSDADGDSATMYEVWDNDGGHNWWADGGYVDASSGYQTSDLSGVWFQGDVAPGTQDLWVRVNDGSEWSEWEKFALVTTNAAPIVSIEDQFVAKKEWIRLNDVLSFSDANGDSATMYEVWDNDGGQNWWADGGYVDASRGYQTSNLTRVWFQGDVEQGTQDLWVRVNDGSEWSEWEKFALVTGTSVSSGRVGGPPESPSFDRDLGVTDASMFAPYAEWVLDNADVSGNPFGVDGKAIFTHSVTGEVRETGIFYKGDGSYAFRFSGVDDGEWTFVTQSADADLDGWTGTVQVAADATARGFVVAQGTKFAQQLGDGSLDAILPNYAMIDSNLEVYYDNPSAILDVIDTFVHEHGFTGLHLPHLGGQLFDIYSSTDISGSRIDGSQGYDPDTRAFEVLEQLIQAAHEAGAVVHIWPWGDSARGQTPEQLPGGENGEEHQRMLEYMADRLGPLPGWTLGYGFDNDEWTSPTDAAEAAAYFNDQTDFDHLTSVRSSGPNSGTNHASDTDWHADQSVADYEHHEPDYEVYVAAFEAEYNGTALDKPVLSGDRFRVRYDGDGKDYTEEQTVDGLWISTMAGGASNIWGNLTDPATGATIKNGQFGSFDYSQATQDQISTWNTFFNNKDRFALDMVRANEFTGGAVEKQYALYSDAEDLLVIYAEDTDTIELNLSQLAGDPDWAGGAQVIAVNTEGAYQELDLGTVDLTDQTIDLGLTADWALVIGPIAGPSNVATGTDGDDTLFANSSYDTVDGGEGIDTLSFASLALSNVQITNDQPDAPPEFGVFVDLGLQGTPQDTGFGTITLLNIENLQGSERGDLLRGDDNANTLDGEGSYDYLEGGGGNDVLRGGDGADVLKGGAGADSLSGGDGYDLVAYFDAETNLYFDFANSLSTFDPRTSAVIIEDVLSDDIEMIAGATNFSNTFDALNVQSTTALMGGRMADAFIGGENTDQMLGNGGNDTMFGNGGDDALLGDAGDDLMFGGAGADVFFMDGIDGHDTIGDLNLVEDQIFFFGNNITGLSQLAFGDVDLDGDGQLDDTLITYSAGGFDSSISVLNVSSDQFEANQSAIAFG